MSKKKSVLQEGQALDLIYKEHIANSKWEMDALQACLTVLQTHNYSANETLLGVYNVIDALHTNISWKLHAIQAKTGTAE